MSSVRSNQGLELRAGSDAASPWEDPREDEERPIDVAEILSDGTVQVLDRAAVDEAVTRWGSGVISGAGWTLWWERRRWD